MEFTYYAPLRILFGEGYISRLPQLTARNGSRVLLVTGRKHLKASEVLDEILNGFKDTKKIEEVILFDKTRENPDCSLVDEAAELISRHNLNIVVAVGGGSAMDLAKAASIAAKQKMPIWELIHKLHPGMDAYPIICSPTTSGSGSEVTRYAVINNDKEKLKVALGSEAIFPRVSLIDPELTYTMKPETVANTGFDALSHAIEAYTSNSACPITDLYCREAISLIGENLPKAYRLNRDAMRNMSLAASLAGMALNVGRASLPHAMEHALSAYRPELPHGRGLSIVMIPFLKRAHRCRPEKFSDIAYLLGRDISNKTLEAAAAEVVDAVEELKASVKLTDTLSLWGFDEKTIVEMVEKSFDTFSHGISNSPCRFSKEEIMNMYLEAL